MKTTNKKRRVLVGIALGLSALSLTACGSSSDHSAKTSDSSGGGSQATAKSLPASCADFSDLVLYVDGGGGSPLQMDEPRGWFQNENGDGTGSYLDCKWSSPSATEVDLQLMGMKTPASTYDEFSHWLNQQSTVPPVQVKDIGNWDFGSLSSIGEPDSSSGSIPLSVYKNLKVKDPSNSDRTMVAKCVVNYHGTAHETLEEFLPDVARTRKSCDDLLAKLQG